MNILTIIISLAIIVWCLTYTVSYGIWTFRENKKGGVALFILALTTAAIPLYLLWTKR